MIYLEFLLHNTCTVVGPDGKQTGRMTYSKVYELYCKLEHQLGVTVQATFFLNHCIADDKEPSAVSLDCPSPAALLPMKNDIDNLLKLVINQRSVPHLLHMCPSHWITLISCHWQTGQSEHCTLPVSSSQSQLWAHCLRHPHYSASCILKKFIETKRETVFVREQAERDICLMHGTFSLLHLWKYSFKIEITNIVLHSVHQPFVYNQAIQFTETSISRWRFYVRMLALY